MKDDDESEVAIYLVERENRRGVGRCVDTHTHTFTHGVRVYDDDDDDDEIK